MPISVSLPPGPPPSGGLPVPELPGVPDPSEILEEVIRRFRQSRFVKAIGLVYAAYQLLTEGRFPGRLGLPDRIQGPETERRLRDQLDDLIPGFRATRDQLERLAELFGESGIVESADAARGLIAEFPPSWLIDP